MKKLIYIVFVGVGLLAVSCSKEDIRPCSASDNNSNRSLRAMESNESGDGTATDDGSITDPNHDRDDVRRRH